MKQRLIVFTRIPEAGANKTRLIPALGPEGAAAFHDRLARHAIGRASGFALRHPGTELEIRVTGGSTVDGRAWLGGGDWKIQEDGDLGERLGSAADEAFEQGADKVILLGTDCPRLGESALGEAFDALDRSDVVIGPALDGGYYLIGLRKPVSRVFEGVTWGGPDVFAQTLERVSEGGLTSTALEVLPDVDLPEDLEDAELALSKGATLSVVIPALNEARLLEKTLESVFRGSPDEVIVADGGSTDGTRSIAERKGARVVEGAKGRAAQMNLAAAAATGEYLLFLHADTVLPEGYRQIAMSTLGCPDVAAGAFRLGIDDDLGAAALIESLVDFRCRFFGSPYGDQGLFVRRSLFDHVGGFPNVPVLEDLEIIETLGGLGRVVVVGDRVLSSGRRWQSEGLIRTFFRHQLMLAAYRLGCPASFVSQLR